ncbi:golvesin C-terminal-like domain-containing protein [Paenibacillus marchantiophytorum]|uniref:golvesin C-terminal-like domain-containing protein n=1 Tax=Paenibacillus marchantiophytorum TaxID=1619310 RepID=UPI001669E1F0|nr:RICIN domain-containing protein [Paenibacillus marchantiophytorum]
MLLLFFGTVFGMPMATQAAGNTYYVATTGNDSNPGTLSSPFKTIAKATSVMAAGDTCIIRGGTYKEVIQPTTSGTAGNPITYKSYTGETVTISATEKVTGWTLHSGNIYKAPMNWNLGMENQVLVDGELMQIARYPNRTDTNLYNLNKVQMDSGSDFTIKDSVLNKPTNYWMGGYVWLKGTWVAQTTSITASSGDEITLGQIPSYSYGSNLSPYAGREFFVFNLFSELDAEREWFYDSSTQTMYLWAPGGVNPSTLDVQIKKRNDCIVLNGVSYVNIEGLSTFGGTIRMEDNSSNNIVKGIDAKYLSHRMLLQNAYYKDDTGVYVGGSNNTLRDSSLAYSSGNLVVVTGTDNKIINNLLHDANYMGTYNGSIFIKGKGHLISYNTVYNAGRDIIQVSNIDAVIIEYNDFGHYGLINKDVGAIYVVKEDGGGTEIRYNRIHDVTADVSSGIYLDQHSHNFVIHHNTVWNTSYIGIKASQPSNFVLMYDNMVNGTMGGTFGVAHDDDGYGTRMYNNVATEGYKIDGDALRYNNTTVGYNQNLYPPTGQNLANPPNPTYMLSTNPYKNRVTNAFFDFSMDSWTKTGAATAVWYRSTFDVMGIDNREVRSTVGSLKLGSGQNGVEQLITGLQPNTTYEYSAWARVPSGETVQIGVKEYGDAPIYKEVTGNYPYWTRQKVQFRTGLSHTSAKVYIWQSSSGAAVSYADDAGLIPVDTVTRIVDNDDPNYSELSGSWLNSSFTGYNGSATRYAGLGASAKWIAPIPLANTYDVYIYKVINSTSDSNTKVEVVHNGVTSAVYEDYSTGTSGWKYLGTYAMTPGQSNYVQITRGNNALRADAVKFVASNNTFDPAVYYKIVNKKSGKLLDVANSSMNIGAKAVQLGNIGGESKRWQIIYNGSNYSLVNKNSGMAVDVAGSAAVSGAGVIQSSYGGIVSQGWQIADTGNGYYRIINANSGMAAAVKDSSLADGAEVIQSPYVGDDNQLWSIVLDTGGDTSVVDNGDANYTEVSGSWTNSSLTGYKGSTVRNSGSSGASAQWTAPMTVGGTYEVFIYKPIHSTSDTNTKVEVVHNGTTSTSYEDYSTGTSGWKYMGTYTMTPGQSNYVKITRGNKSLRADAVKFVRAD